MDTSVFNSSASAWFLTRVLWCMSGVIASLTEYLIRNDLRCARVAVRPRGLNSRTAGPAWWLWLLHSAQSRISGADDLLRHVRSADGLVLDDLGTGGFRGRGRLGAAVGCWAAGLGGDHIGVLSRRLRRTRWRAVGQHQREYHHRGGEHRCHQEDVGVADTEYLCLYLLVKAVQPGRALVDHLLQSRYRGPVGGGHQCAAIRHHLSLLRTDQCAESGQAETAGDALPDIGPRAAGTGRRRRQCG